MKPHSIARLPNTRRAKSMATLFLYFPLCLALYIITKHFLNKIRNFPPSPFPSLPIIGHLHLLKKPVYWTLSRISFKLGPVYMLHLGSRRLLVVSSPSIAEECFTKNDVIFANRPRVLVAKHFGFNYTSLSWTSYGDHWRNLRKMVTIEVLSAYRLQTLSLSTIRLEEVKSMICGIFHNQNQLVDMKAAFFELTLNVMMRMIAGKRCYGDSVSDVEESKRFRAIHAETFLLGGQNFIGDFLPWIQSKEMERRLSECQKKRDGFMQDLIEERKRKLESDCSERKNNLIEVLLSLQETEPEYYTDHIIKGLMLVLLSAGTDTSSNTMEWVLSLLLNHPEVLKKNQLEIDGSVGHDRLINEADIAQLPYLRSIINETLRMYPPAPLLVPHESSKECVVGGFHIPRGTMLFVNIWAIQNDPKIWPDPRKFKPERFEGLEGAREVFKLMPFGYGRRSCPGEGLALRVVGLALGSLIQCFEWQAIDDKPMDMSVKPGFTMSKAQPLKVICPPRPSMLKHLSQL